MKEKHSETSRLLEGWRNIDELYHQYALSMGLTRMSFVVLEAIYRLEDHVTQKEIVKLTHLPKQTVSVVMNTFLDQGYVEAKEDKDDRRKKRIRLTKKGAEFSRCVFEPIFRAEAEVLSTLDPTERKLINRIVKELENTLVKAIVEETCKDNS